MDIYIVTDSYNSETRAFYREKDARKCAAEIIRGHRREHAGIETISSGRAWNVYYSSYHYVCIDALEVE